MPGRSAEQPLYELIVAISAHDEEVRIKIMCLRDDLISQGLLVSLDLVNTMGNAMRIHELLCWLCQV
jgi:hypothetical protein